jgi:hypothetical protein
MILQAGRKINEMPRKNRQFPAANSGTRGKAQKPRPRGDGPSQEQVTPLWLVDPLSLASCPLPEITIAGQAHWVGPHQLRVRYFFGERTIKARLILTNCGGRYGDSGSAVVNARGELVGVHFAGTSSESDAIEIREVRAMLAEAIGQSVA